MNSSVSAKLRPPLFLVVPTIIWALIIMTGLGMHLNLVAISFLDNDLFKGIFVVTLLTSFFVCLAWVFWYLEQAMEKECSRKRQALIEQLEMEEQMLEENPHYQLRPISPAPSVTPVQQAIPLASLISAGM